MLLSEYDLYGLIIKACKLNCLVVFNYKVVLNYKTVFK